MISFITRVFKFISRKTHSVLTKVAPPLLTAYSGTTKQNKLLTQNNEVISSFLGEKIIFLDVGARYGPIDIVNANKELFDIILAEPEEEEKKRLESQGWKVIPYLLGATNGNSTLYITQHPGHSSTLHPDGPFRSFYGLRPERSIVASEVTLPMRTIEMSMKELSVEHLDLIKIDTQGTELDILKGMGDISPALILSEISFLEIYKNNSLIWDVCQLLHDRGYMLFDLKYAERPKLDQAILKKGFEQGVPAHGDAGFMPNWKTEKGQQIIYKRDRQYAALMLMFGMKDILVEVLHELNTPNSVEILASLKTP